MWTFVWCMTMLFNGCDGKEPTDRLIPPGWKGNPWGPAATLARASGEIPALPMTPLMKQWDKWGKTVLRDGDILFRQADARILFGHFPFSRFIARASGSPYSHTAIVALENGTPVVYDTTKAGVRRQPFHVWILDNVGSFGVKRVRPELASRTALAIRFCRDVYERQVPFDFELSTDDRALYCVEMTEKAYRAAGLPLSEPIRLGDMENVTKYPICVFGFLRFSDLSLDQLAWFPGNERHGIWSSPNLVTVYPPTPASNSGTTGQGRQVGRKPTGSGQRTMSRG